MTTALLTLDRFLETTGYALSEIETETIKHADGKRR